MDSHVDATGKPLSAAGMAELVAAHQDHLPSSKRCKRQDIENLLKKGLSTPRYIVALASAMGTTAESLQAGGGRSVKSRPEGAIATVDVSSQAFTQYVRDVSISVEAFARNLDDAQRAGLRNMLVVMFQDRLNLLNLDLKRLFELLSDNSYSANTGKRPSKRLGEPVRHVAHPVTKMVDLGHRNSTDVAGTAPRSPKDKP